GPLAVIPSSAPTGRGYPAARQPTLSGNIVHGHTRFPPHLPLRKPPDHNTTQSAFHAPGLSPSRRQTGCKPATATRDKNRRHRDVLRRTDALLVNPRSDTSLAMQASPSAFRPLSLAGHVAHQRLPARTGCRPARQQTGETRSSAHHHVARNLSTPFVMLSFLGR